MSEGETIGGAPSATAGDETPSREAEFKADVAREARPSANGPLVEPSHWQLPSLEEVEPPSIDPDAEPPSSWFEPQVVDPDAPDGLPEAFAFRADEAIGLAWLFRRCERWLAFYVHPVERRRLEATYPELVADDVDPIEHYLVEAEERRGRRRRAWRAAPMLLLSPLLGAALDYAFGYLGSPFFPALLVGMLYRRLEGQFAYVSAMTRARASGLLQAAMMTGRLAEQVAIALHERSARDAAQIPLFAAIGGVAHMLILQRFTWLQLAVAVLATLLVALYSIRSDRTSRLRLLGDDPASAKLALGVGFALSRGAVRANQRLALFAIRFIPMAIFVAVGLAGGYAASTFQKGWPGLIVLGAFLLAAFVLFEVGAGWVRRSALDVDFEEDAGENP